MRTLSLILAFVVVCGVAQAKDLKVVDNLSGENPERVLPREGECPDGYKLTYLEQYSGWTCLIVKDEPEKPKEPVGHLNCQGPCPGKKPKSQKYYSDACEYWIKYMEGRMQRGEADNEHLTADASLVTAYCTRAQVELLQEIKEAVEK